MSKNAQLKSARWVRPELKKINAGSAENTTTGIDDGGPVGTARS